MSSFYKPDASGDGEIIGESGWATHIHRSVDPLNPWYSVKIEETGERISGLGDFNAAVEKLLPPSWLNNE